MKNINKFIIFLIIITIVLLVNNNKDNFTMVKNINIQLGQQGNFGQKGPIGNKGPAGPIDSYNDSLMESQLNNQLKLGSSKNMFNNDYQLKLSSRIKSNGSKLKLDKLPENDKKSNYIKCETNNKNNFYLNNEKMYLDGNFDIHGDIKVRNNNQVKSLKYDIIPPGLIFPYYFDNMSIIGSGFYILKFNQEQQFLPRNRIELHKTDNNLFKISISDTNYVRYFFKYVEDPIAETYSITYVTNSNDSNCFFRLTKSNNNKYNLVTNKYNKYLTDNFTLSDDMIEFELFRTVPFGWKLHSECNDNFIVGANSNINNFFNRKTGGNNNITLNENNLPPHKHKTNLRLEYSIQTNPTTINSNHKHSFRVLGRHIDDPNGNEMAFVLAHNRRDLDLSENSDNYNVREFRDKYGDLPFINLPPTPSAPPTSTRRIRSGMFEDTDRLRSILENLSSPTTSVNMNGPFLEEIDDNDKFETKLSGTHKHLFNAEFPTPRFNLENIVRTDSEQFAIAPETVKILYIEKE